MLAPQPLSSEVPRSHGTPTEQENLRVAPEALFPVAHASNHTSVRKVSGVLAVVVIAVAIVVFAFIPFERPQDVIEDKATDLRALADPVLHGGAKVNAAKDSRISVLPSSL